MGLHFLFKEIMINKLVPQMFYNGRTIKDNVKLPFQIIPGAWDVIESLLDLLT